MANPLGPHRDPRELIGTQGNLQTCPLASAEPVRGYSRSAGTRSSRLVPVRNSSAGKKYGGLCCTECTVVRNQCGTSFGSLEPVREPKLPHGLLFVCFSPCRLARNQCVSSADFIQECGTSARPVRNQEGIFRSLSILSRPEASQQPAGPSVGGAL